MQRLLDDEGWRLIKGGFAKEHIPDTIIWLNDAIKRAETDPMLEAEFENNYAEGYKAVRKIRRLIWNNPPFWTKVLEQSGIFNLGKTLISGQPSIIFHAAFLKPKRVGTMIGFHQDQALWNHEYPGAINIWVALNDSDPENGCIQLFPKSHLKGLLPHTKDPNYNWHPIVEIDKLNNMEPCYVSMSAGDVLIWHRFMVHGSGPNLSDRDRFGMVLVFADASRSGFKAKDVYRI